MRYFHSKKLSDHGSRDTNEDSKLALANSLMDVDLFNKQKRLVNLKDLLNALQNIISDRIIFILFARNRTH